MQKQKKFIALALVVFLAFLALGKYKQSTALASADVLYTVEAKDKKTGQTVKFEIQQTKKHRYRVKNTKTGQHEIIIYLSPRQDGILTVVALVEPVAKVTDDLVSLILAQRSNLFFQVLL